METHSPPLIRFATFAIICLGLTILTTFINAIRWW
ncbi:Uncharacterised protein [Rodentibacter pneumotropicus]|uniref:Uncharacterized protein n=1 Tax=Rodentibacter pneumotropicus TaxID=758 RepID=A0A3S4XUD6_9PAST|nr:Uncharacterised protein [Rodentibacter pneumotropicus]